MDVFDKLKILTDAAKYDVACTSSGVDRKGGGDGIGNAAAGGICHSFAADGRCIALLKILMSNACSYDCKYCLNRVSNDTPRATFTPKEIAELTINFYRRNYIEGLFLSSGVLGTPDNTTELMIEALRILREEYRFYGYIHAKAIPGTSRDLLNRLGLLCDRMSVNIELPSNDSLVKLAPSKTKDAILTPMKHIRQMIGESKNELQVYKHAPVFVPAGQSTQMIIGATPETDYSIIKLTEGLYDTYKLKRVFFSAYIPVAENSLLPAIDSKPPMLREHRLYQADWLLRFYGFTADEILDADHPHLNPYIDPKCNWALNHPEFFPVEINKASYDDLLRVPGIGVLSAKKIVKARRMTKLNFTDLKKLGVVLKRAAYFILCEQRYMDEVVVNHDNLLNSLVSKTILKKVGNITLSDQCSMFDNEVSFDEIRKSLTGQL